MISVLVFAAGVLVGAMIVWLVYRAARADSGAVARAMLEQTQVAKTREVELVVAGVKDSVRAETSTVFAQTMRDLTSVLGDLKTERASQFGEIRERLARAIEQTDKLQSVTEDLRAVLANPTARGQWGERMAEDVLRLAGFIEGVNYVKQTSADGGASRPDFTFMLPQNMKVNMDVKFPFNSYLAYVESTGEVERDAKRQQFVRDVRNRIREVTQRDYIDTEDGTLGYVLLFIPNEGIYSFIHECDRTILDEALQSKVIVCSPFTLYAVLAVIRQAIDNFRLANTSEKVLALLGGFQKQWDAFSGSFDKLGRAIDGVDREYQSLMTTRRLQLERQLRRIEELRADQGIAIEAPEPPMGLSSGDADRVMPS
ncbi:MAG TPA: DNA recombination protein RmuC [Gemmatimonadaceae bacterium]